MVWSDRPFINIFNAWCKNLMAWLQSSVQINVMFMWFLLSLIVTEEHAHTFWIFASIFPFISCLKFICVWISKFQTWENVYWHRKVYSYCWSSDKCVADHICPLLTTLWYKPSILFRSCLKSIYIAWFAWLWIKGKWFLMLLITVEWHYNQFKVY